jgi:hypothetical protein
MQFATSSTTTRAATGVRRNPFTSQNARLWAVQGAVAALFVFAGVMKLVTPAAEQAEQSGLPGALLVFIGACELLGGLGLVLPGVFRTARVLIPVAAAGLVVIMTGAVVVSVADGAGVLAAFPGAVGLACVYVMRGRK